MKKLLTMIIVSALVISTFAACGSKKEEVAAEVKNEAEKVEAVVEEVEEKAEEVVEEVEAEAEEAVEEIKEAIEGDAVDCPLEDGVYSAVFDTDSSMFRVNEACDKRGVLTVENGQMTIHISLVSKNIVNLFPGTAEDAGKDGAEILEPTEDEVTYSDGSTETVYGFDVPVKVLDEEFDLALIGKKGKWYDHKVSVSDPVKE